MGKLIVFEGTDGSGKSTQFSLLTRRLEARGVSVTRRREMGADIQGACGQLRRKHLSQEGTLA